MKKKAAIYHFTDGSDKRPVVNQKQLNILEDYAKSIGFTDVEIFCDKSLLVSEHTEFAKLLSCISKFDALITKDFYHISKNTGKFMNTMCELRDKGIPIYSIENGAFYWDEVPIDKPLKIATYCCRFGTSSEMTEIIPISNDILNLFINKKTNWILVDQYIDESEHQKDGEQIQLHDLIKNKKNYDLLLVHTLNDIHWRTAKFCRIREELQMDIYSLHEGYLPYRNIQKERQLICGI